MSVYLINLVIVTIGSFLATLVKKKKYNYEKNSYNYFFIIIVLVSLISVSGFRYKVGTDFTTYSEIYINANRNTIDWLQPEVGFQILIKLLNIITSNPQFFFFVTAAFTNIGVLIFLKNNTNSLPLSMYFYISTFIYYGTMNGIRQYIATVIIILGFKALLEGDFKKYIVFIIVASLFHTSVFIMIPLFFIVREDTYSKISIIVLGIFIFAFVFYQQFLNILFKFFGESQYSHYETILGDTSNGANILRILVWLLPVVIILLYRKRALFIYGQELNVILNLCIIGTLFMILAYRHVFFARFCMYFDMYYLLLLPKICKLFDVKTNRILTFAMMIAYFAYSTALLLSGESWIYPYNYNLNLF